MLELLIKSILERNVKNGGGESTVVALHCAQMREWGIRGGAVELRPVQDDTQQTRLKFFNSIWEHNQLSERLDNVMDSFVCRGEVLWYFQPDPNNEGKYLIEYFIGGLNNPEPQYKLFYKPGGREIEKVYIRYSYEQQTTSTGVINKQKKWVVVKIDYENITYSESLNKPEFDLFYNNNNQDIGYQYNDYNQAKSQSYKNPFKPFLPIIISKNNASQLGQPGADDFYWIQNLIETHEGLVQKAHKNLRMFANPILITTRTANEVLTQQQNQSNTWASANRFTDGYGGIYSGSTNSLDVPSPGMQRSSFGMHSVNYSEGQLNTIVGNVGEGERFGFIQADAVSGDQNLWIKQIRELIHWILGGVDPLAGISAGATFGEIKTLFGRVQNTANKKANSLFGYTGLAKVYERVLWLEETKFKKWFLERLQSVNDGYFKRLTLDKFSDELCQQLWVYVQNGQLKINTDDIIGIIPFGDRKVSWRYTREVFQNTTREELDRSIAARNEREDGLSQEFVLRKQYPNMTDQEIRNAMSGFSPRVVKNASEGISIIMKMFETFMQIPDPENQKVPWAFRLGLKEIIEQAMISLKKEISYGVPKYEPAKDEAKQKSLNDLLASISGSNNGVVDIINNGIIQPTVTGDEYDVLRSIGLPASVSDALRYKSSKPSSGFYRQDRSAGESTNNPNNQSPESTKSVFGREFSEPANNEPGTTRTKLGSTGEIQPELLHLYTKQLRELISKLSENS